MKTMKRLLPPVLLAAILLFSAGAASAGTPAPEWADVLLNGDGFPEEGVYILEDVENGRWMYADPSLRIQIVRTRETPEKMRADDYPQDFYCYTADIWCDTDQGEGPVTLWADPEDPGNTFRRKTVAAIAAEQQAVFAVSTDLFTARDGKAAGVVIRNGQILADGKPRHAPGGLPSFDTLALYPDGRAESFFPAEKRAEDYLADGATQVYTFGPVLVRDGEIPEEILRHGGRSLNPRNAFGIAEPGHYICVVCEGRLKEVNGSTGASMGTLARIMQDRGCTLAVNLDGGQTAVMAFLGKQLNLVAKVPSGRVTSEVLAFGAGKAETAPETQENP